MRAHSVERGDESRDSRRVLLTDHLAVDGVEVADKSVILEAQQAQRMALGQVVCRQEGRCSVRLLSRLAQRCLLLVLAALSAVVEQR